MGYRDAEDEAWLSAMVSCRQLRSIDDAARLSTPVSVHHPPKELESMLRTRLIHPPAALLAVGILCCVWTSSASGDTVAADVQAAGAHQTAAFLTSSNARSPSTPRQRVGASAAELHFGSIVVKVAVGESGRSSRSTRASTRQAAAFVVCDSAEPASVL
jgi:hypothetical protein